MSGFVKRAVKLRCYPDVEQEALFSRTFGCVRFVHNKALAFRSAAWEDGQRRVSYVESSAVLTAWKKDPELAWLGEVSSVPLQQSLRHLQSAFVNFWAGRARYPRFKSKRRGRDTAEFTRSAFTYQAPGQDWVPSRHPAVQHNPGEPVLMLAKTNTPLVVAWHRQMPAGTPTTATLSRDASGLWFVSLLFDTEIMAAPEPVYQLSGVDLNQADTAVTISVTTDGTQVVGRHQGLMPRKALESQLRRAQRAYARSTKGSKNRAKAAGRVARIHARIADARRDHLHNLSTLLVRENQALGIEDLAVKDMTVSARGTVENPGRDVAKKAVSNRNNLDVGYRMLRTMIEYKAEQAGRTLVVVDRYYPSTRLCSTPGCDYCAPTMPTHIRNWTCPTCGTHHDRDVNAAHNITTAASAELACGPTNRNSDTIAKPDGRKETGNLPGQPRKPHPSGRGR